MENENERELVPLPSPGTRVLEGEILTAEEGEMERMTREIIRIFEISPQELGLASGTYGYE